MEKIDKNKAVQLVLKNRFGTINPSEIENLMEVNVFEAMDDSSPMGIGVELIIELNEGKTIKEEYQVSAQGIIYSWGDSPVIDKRSQDHSLLLDS